MVASVVLKLLLAKALLAGADPSCSAHPKCAQIGMTAGACCPTAGGSTLECCSAAAGTLAPVPSPRQLRATTPKPLAAAVYAARPKFAQQIKGISWGPVPLKSPQNASKLHQDDWMDETAKPMWGKRGRADLRVMKALGANMVRLYGNNPDSDHSRFLNEAEAEGLRVTPGISDFPFFQKQVGSCESTNYNCYDQIMPLYLENLRRGFLTRDREYHPAMAYMIIINEADLKMPHNATVWMPDGPRLMCKAIISAFDAMLDAEKAAGLRGAGINFTATFSFAKCTACGAFQHSPALGQMAELEKAMLDPASYGYRPKNDLARAYRTRWTHSFNTANTADELPGLFLNSYQQEFPTTPVFIGEYHRPGANLLTDLPRIFNESASSSLLLGASFFQYQVAYWKGGSEEEFGEKDFGMFELGNYVISRMPYFGETYNVYCLVPAHRPGTQGTLPAAVAQGFGGPYLDPEELCIPSPESVELNETGYRTILGQQNVSRMAVFAERVVQHLGAVVSDAGGLRTFAQQHVDGDSTFEDMVRGISTRPSWTHFDPEARCVADRDAFPAQIQDAIGIVCGLSTGFNCSDVPDACKPDDFAVGDWIFGQYYKEVNSNPLQNCYIGGAAIFASASIYAIDSKPECLVAEATPTTTTSSKSAVAPLRSVGSWAPVLLLTSVLFPSDR